MKEFWASEPGRLQQVLSFQAASCLVGGVVACLYVSPLIGFRVLSDELDTVSYVDIEASTLVGYVSQNYFRVCVVGDLVDVHIKLS